MLDSQGSLWPYPARSGQQLFLCKAACLKRISVIGGHVIGVGDIGAGKGTAVMQGDAGIIIVDFQGLIVIKDFDLLTDIAIWDTIVTMILGELDMVITLYRSLDASF